MLQKRHLLGSGIGVAAGGVAQDSGINLLHSLVVDGIPLFASVASVGLGAHLRLDSFAGQLPFPELNLLDDCVGYGAAQLPLYAVVAVGQEKANQLLR